MRDKGPFVRIQSWRTCLNSIRNCDGNRNIRINWILCCIQFSPAFFNQLPDSLYIIKLPARILLKVPQFLVGNHLGQPSEINTTWRGIQTYPLQFGRLRSHQWVHNTLAMLHLLQLCRASLHCFWLFKLVLHVLEHWNYLKYQWNFCGSWHLLVDHIHTTNTLARLTARFHWSEVKSYFQSPVSWIFHKACDIELEVNMGMQACKIRVPSRWNTSIKSSFSDRWRVGLALLCSDMFLKRFRCDFVAMTPANVTVKRTTLTVWYYPRDHGYLQSRWFSVPPCPDLTCRVYSAWVPVPTCDPPVADLAAACCLPQVTRVLPHPP